jgi:NAD(P)-dependent dehydrogenase (short-subunit alcohol dehydrogenase family)
MRLAAPCNTEKDSTQIYRQGAVPLVLSELEQLPDFGASVQADVTRTDDIQRMLDLAYQRWGRLDVMFNNAGIVASFGIVATSLITLAALIGVALLSKRIFKTRISGMMIGIHATFAVSGFVILTAYVLLG